MRRIFKIIVGVIAVANASCSGPFSVSGTVVDQHGNPIDGVSLHLAGAVATKYEIDAYGGETSFDLENGRFRVSCGFCTAVHLFFSKEGYYPQSLDLAFFERKNGLKIVMRKVEFPVKLRKYEGRLETGPEIEDRVLGFGQPPPYDRRLSEITAATVIPARAYVTLTPDLNPDGSIATDPAGHRRVPARVRLDFSPARGGIVFHQPSTMNLREGLREMFVAPDVEYSQSIELELGTSHRFFYCRIEGRYCKGIVHAPVLTQREGADFVSTHIAIHLNPNYGNRSLDDPTTY
jgi:hypothetical protein